MLSQNLVLTAVIATCFALFFGLMTAALDRSNSPFNYRLPPYEAYFQPHLMAQFNRSETSRKKAESWGLRLKLLLIAVIWTAAIAAIFAFHLSLPFL